jgi:hypothetical protein
MRTFDVQSVALSVSQEKAFRFIANPANLPKWAQAFKHVVNGAALLQTPNGAVEIRLEVEASAEAGTIDWVMHFPDGSAAHAYSRVIPQEGDRSLYSFVLTGPPVPLEQLEGALEQQSRILKEELETLRALLES